MTPSDADLRAVFHDELARLRSLGVQLQKLGKKHTETQLRRFAEEFVDPDRRDLFLRAASAGAVDHVKWLRADSTSEPHTKGVLGWLARGAEKLACVRLDRRPRLPAVKLSVDTLDETWATSWPGVYVNFPSGRALVVTLDYEVVRCDLRAAVGSPYR